MRTEAVKRWFREAGALCSLSLRKFVGDGGMLLATALAYTTLLSLVPITVLSFSIFSSFEASAAMLDQVRQTLFAHLIPASGDVIYGYIETFTRNAGKLSLFGLVFLIVTAYSLVRTLERAFTRIWGFGRRRSSFTQFVTFWAVLTLVPFLMAGSVYLSTWLRTTVGDIPKITVLGNVVLPILLTWSAFFCLYQFVPKAEVRWPAALIGAVVAGSLWEIGKWGFEFYVRSSSSLQDLYGSLAVIPLFLIWLYLTWIFVLVGAELAFLVQLPPRVRRADSGQFTAFQSYYALRAVLLIGRAFQKGESPLPPDALGDHLDLDSDHLEPILERLKDAGILAHTGDGGGAYLLARAPSTIHAEEIVRAAAGDPHQIPAEASGSMDRYTRGLVEKIRDVQHSGWGGDKLETLLREADDHMLSASLKASDVPRKA